MPTITFAITIGLILTSCVPAAFARPRTWSQETSPASVQPSWMPLAIGDRTPNPAVARITAVDGNSLAQGSGTLVETRGQRGLVVTNWHVIRDAKGPIVATFPDGFRSAATVLKVDKDWDLAALLIWRPNATPIAVSTIAPRPGDALTIAGYGSGSYRAMTGRCTQYVAPGRNMPYEMVELSAEARQGDSGGPILNGRGELAGVLFGAGGGTTSGSFCGRVRWFLDTAWPANQPQDADVLVSIPAGQMNTHWPADRMLAIPETHAPLPPVTDVPSPNYSVGSTVSPATIDIRTLQNATATNHLKQITGDTPLEQGKSILAAIGILAVLVQVTRVARAKH